MSEARCFCKDEEIIELVTKRPGLFCQQINTAFRKRELHSRLTKLCKQGILFRKKEDLKTNQYFIKSS